MSYETLRVPANPGRPEKRIALRGVRLGRYFAHTRSLNGAGASRPDTLTHLPTGGVVLSNITRGEARRVVVWLEANVKHLRLKNPATVTECIREAVRKIGGGRAGALLSDAGVFLRDVEAGRSP